MKPTNAKKLRLDLERICELTDRELAAAVGGDVTLPPKTVSICWSLPNTSISTASASRSV